MSVEIIPITDHEAYKVNGHVVYKDSLNNWTCKIALSNKELEAFAVYRESIIENKRVKKHTKSTYRTH